jgi:hypothetical protein
MHRKEFARRHAAAQMRRQTTNVNDGGCSYLFVVEINSKNSLNWMVARWRHHGQKKVRGKPQEVDSPGELDDLGRYLR